MSRVLVALSLYLGLGVFFALNALALLRGLPPTTAVLRGLTGLVLIAMLGVFAGLVTREWSRPSESPEE
ncbi:MAG: hypothetical protein ACM3US_13755 [Sphingomonadaceae bacterium]